jgi:hypothetical protein
MSDRKSEIVKTSVALIIDLVVWLVAWRLISRVYDFHTVFSGWRYWTAQFSMSIFLCDVLRLNSKLIVWATGGYLEKDKNTDK